MINRYFINILTLEDSSFKRFDCLKENLKILVAVGL